MSVSKQALNAGQYHFRVEPTVFSMASYTSFTKAIASQVAEFTRRRAEAADRVGAVRENKLLREWLTQKEREALNMNVESTDVDEISDWTCITSSMSASVSKIKCEVGQVIKSADDVMIILEAMKMEINVPAGEENIGKVVKGFGKGLREGGNVQAGDPLVWVSRALVTSCVEAR